MTNGMMGGGGRGGEGRRRRTGEGTAQPQYPTSDLTTLDLNSTSPGRNPAWRASFWTLWNEAILGGVGGAWWAGSAEPR